MTASVHGGRGVLLEIGTEGPGYLKFLGVIGVSLLSLKPPWQPVLCDGEASFSSFSAVTKNFQALLPAPGLPVLLTVPEKGPWKESDVC